MKGAITIIVIALLGIGAFVMLGPSDIEVADKPTEEVTEETVTEIVVSDGEYEVIPEKSRLNWAGKKPLIDGYINSGVIGITSGSISLNGASSSGSFEIDMSTLSVSETKAKPGAESTLEDHLKGDRWFNVAEFPTATFEIQNITSANDATDPFKYTVSGELTMKGKTNPVTFPARIYETEEGETVAEASLEIDRTLWDITSGSGSFFDDLADNVIDDMVALSFKLVAKEKDEAMMEEEMTEE